MAEIPDTLPRAVLDSLGMAVLVVHRTGEVRRANPVAGQFWHLVPEKLEAHTLQQLFGADSPICTHLHRALEEESSFAFEAYRFDQGEGLPPLSLRVQIDPVQGAPGSGELAVVTFWDTSQRAQIEAREQEERRLDSIGLMILRLAHELHNPLSGIKGATQLLWRRMGEGSDLREFPNVILTELERLERLVKNLLSQGGDQEVRAAPFNLHELLDTVIWFQGNSPGDTAFVRDYDPSLPELCADRDKMHQVFLNLLRNAADASPAGGRVIVRTRALGPWRPDERSPDPSRTYFRIEVEDQGEGVPEALLPNLFTPLFTSKKRGTGLGLAVSYQIVRGHQGQLAYARGPAGGALFSVTLPMEPVER